jgi:hypothetical protein
MKEFELLNKEKKEIKNKKLESNIKFLKDNGIQYTETNIKNVVRVNNLVISLLTFKVKYDGSNVWYNYSRVKLITTLGLN